MRCIMCFPTCLKNEFQNKKVLIIADLEGIIGLESLNDFSYNNQLLETELRMTITVLRSYNFSDIYICNIHNNGMAYDKSLKLLAEVERASLVNLNELSSNLSFYSFAIMIGFHGMIGSGGKHDHNFRLDITQCKIKNEIMGEVGLFARYLENNGVRVLFISGEGNFIKEIENELSDIMVHNVMYEKDVQEEFCEFQKKLNLCISTIKKRKTINQVSEVTIAVDNSDKYILLSRYPYGFKVEKGSFVFKSIDEFFENLVSFCVALQDASLIIRNINLRFINQIKESRKQALVPNEFVKIPMNLITESMRCSIAQKLGLNYEHI